MVKICDGPPLKVTNSCFSTTKKQQMFHFESQTPLAAVVIMMAANRKSGGNRIQQQVCTGRRSRGREASGRFPVQLTVNIIC